MISNIQATRGLAALAVVFYHTGYLINYVHTEFYGVATFFVISGFLMPYITRESADNFMVDRLVRIVPLYWFFTIMFYVGVGGSRPFEMLAKSLLFIPGNDVRGDPHPLLNVGWTLNIEMFFYVLFALALVINRRSAPIIVAVLLLGAKFVLGGCQQRPECQLYAHHYTNYLILGIGAFYLWQLLHKSLPRVRSIIVFIAPLFFHRLHRVLH